MNISTWSVKDIFFEDHERVVVTTLVNGLIGRGWVLNEGTSIDGLYHGDVSDDKECIQIIRCPEVPYQRSYKQSKFNGTGRRKN